MENLFIYGSLRHIPLLETIVGHRLVRGHLTSATLAEHSAVSVKGQSYPMLQSSPNDSAEGLLLTGISEQDLRRLDYYESGFGYQLRALDVKINQGMQSAKSYVPKEAGGTADTLTYWAFEDWLSNWGDLAMLAAAEAMEYFGQIDSDQLARRFASINRRAASVLRGRADDKQPDFASKHSREDVSIENQKIAYSNFYAMREYDLRFRQFNGEMSDTVNRASFIGFDVAIVLPYDPLLDCVLLVEQFRLGPYARGAQSPWVLEPVAGHVDVGETPRQAAHRETSEEAGLELKELIEITQTYPSPGASSEYYHIYLGLCDLQGKQGANTGEDSENEDIHSHILTYDQLMEFVDSGAANILPLVFAANWLARNRKRLRSSA